jgi:site-specific DNA-methyltransferase (adenine-specific)
MQIQTNYNPDVLSCLANLSNDEVFTPPSLANQMLDLLPNELWSDPKAKFLDPVCKSGVFLREIAKRLMVGLESHIPGRQDRINHIFKNQIFGVAITELTSLLSRRSIYCSKSADSEYSVCEAFTDEKGNILYERIEHTWRSKKCIYCGASQDEYNREEDLETHAYQFIHIENPVTIFNMKFDVIVGNPPYQLNDGGGTGSSAKPIYNLFIEQAKKLNPKYLSMIVPARWYSGGKGLDDFRGEMLKDKRIRKLVDFPDSRDCFPGVDIAGGVCYFLWERDSPGTCEVEVVRKNEKTRSKRNLDEFENFVRDNISVDIIHKVRNKADGYLDVIVSSRMPFGLPSNIKPGKAGELSLITSNGDGRISRDKVKSGTELIDKWKVLLSKASNDHGGQPDKEGKRRIFSRVEVMPPNTVCTESYLVVGGYDSEEEANNMCSFLKTRFCRYLVSTVLLTQNITKGKFIFVPKLAMDTKWDDQLLYEEFSLNLNEIDSIESLIRPMN